MRINILEYLEDTVARIPDKTAFVGGDTSLTFGELYQQARAVGSFLCNHAWYKEPIAVFMDKQPTMIAAFLGVVYSGNYYIPLDAEMPAYRISLILETVKPRVILCGVNNLAMLDGLGLADTAHLYDEVSKTELDINALASIRERAIDADPVYVVFTSGSTGVPKGVVANHRSVIDYIENLCAVMRFNEDTVFGNQTPLYVDACLKEIFPTLKYGATTYLIPKSLFMFPVRLIEYLNDNGINTLCWVVSALTIISSFGALDKKKPETLTTIAFGSEVFPVKQFNRWRRALPSARFVHLYGPTEATGMSAYFEANRDFDENESIPVGRPFRNTEILLLTDEGREAVADEPGEICIRGVGLTMGYYNDFEKTNAAFVQNPLVTAYPDLIYKTGDIGKRNKRGELMFISRRDQQIKHMGHRIELAEIEMAANRTENVRMTCCVFDEKASRIILYYVGDPSPTEMLAYCRELLPRYMAPYACIPMESLPLTSNGKLDRVKLLALYREAKENK